MTLKIALDVDSTIADTNVPANEVLEGPNHNLGYGDIESWGWGVEKWGEDFLNALHGVWKHQPLNIPQSELNVGDKVEELKEFGEVHIVTHQPESEQVTRGKKAWLAYHGIEPDEFRAVDRDVSKTELDYDVYIDDKPSLPEELSNSDNDAVLFLRDRKYNRDVDIVWPEQVYRVYGLDDVIETLHIRF